MNDLIWQKNTLKLGIFLHIQYSYNELLHVPNWFGPLTVTNLKSLVSLNELSNKNI